jgi:hypothetical protein
MLLEAEHLLNPDPSSAAWSAGVMHHLCRYCKEVAPLGSFGHSRLWAVKSYQLCSMRLFKV